MADEDDRLAGLDQVLQDAEELLALLRREHAGRFVEDEEVGTAVQDLHDLGSLLQSDREVAHAGVGIKRQAVFTCQRGDLFASLGAIVEPGAGDRFSPEHHVLADGEDRDQHEVLVDHPDAEGDGVSRTGDARELSVDQDLARIWMHQSVEDVHQRGLARSVLAHKGVDLAGADGEVNVVVGHDPGKRLRDAAHLERVGRDSGAHSVPGT